MQDKNALCADYRSLLYPHSQIRSLTAQISGMTCSACSGSAERALLATKGVTKAAINFVTGLAEVWFNSDSTGEWASALSAILVSVSEQRSDATQQHGLHV